MPRKARPSLATDLAALRANNVTSATFHPDGKLASVEMTPLLGQLEDQPDERGTMSLPSQVTGGHPMGGPATAPTVRPPKPKDLLRDLILADSPEAPQLEASDLPEDDDGFDDADIEGPAASEPGTEAFPGADQAGLPDLGPGKD